MIQNSFPIQVISFKLKTSEAEAILYANFMASELSPL